MSTGGHLAAAHSSDGISIDGRVAALGESHAWNDGGGIDEGVKPLVRSSKRDPS